jgi:hypothetical protein
MQKLQNQHEWKVEPSINKNLQLQSLIRISNDFYNIIYSAEYIPKIT